MAMLIGVEALPQNAKHLLLTSMCSDDPSTYLRWRVRNQNNYPVNYTWKVIDGGVNAPSSQTVPGQYIAQPGDNYFFSPVAASGNNTMVLYVNNVEQNGGRKAAGKQKCASRNFEIFVSCVKKLDPCTYLVTFGYNNDNPGLTFNIPLGQNNRFTGGNVIKGQPDTIFYPGFHKNAFKIRIGCNTNIVWHLKGPFGPKAVNTSAPNTNQCQFPVKPYVSSIENSVTKPGIFEVWFGYEYNDTDTVNIPLGADNQLVDAVWGTPVTQFVPGKHDKAFMAEFTGNKMEWQLKDFTNSSNKVRAYSQYAGQPLLPVKPSVKCIVKNEDGSTTAYFNYRNMSTSTQFIPKGNRNYLVGESGTIPVVENFLPGYNEYALKATFTGKEIKWIIVGADGVLRAASTYDEYCKICDSQDLGAANRMIASAGPNPAKDHVVLILKNSDSNTDQYMVEVFDIYGKSILKNAYSASTSDFTIPIDQAPPGVYFVKVTCNDKSETMRILKQ